MKYITKLAFILLMVFGISFLLESCASSRNTCNCNDLNKNYKIPKSHKKNIY